MNPIILQLLLANGILVASPVALGAGSSAALGTIVVETTAKSFLRQFLQPLVIKLSAAGGISGVLGGAAAGTIAVLSSPYVLVGTSVVSAVMVGKAVYDAVQKSDKDFQYSVVAAAAPDPGGGQPPVPPPPGGFEEEFIKLLLEFIIKHKIFKYKWQFIKALTKALRASENGEDGLKVFLEELSFSIVGKELAYIFKNLELFTKTKYFGDCSSYLSQLIVESIKNTYHGKSSKEFAMKAIDKMCQNKLSEGLDIILEEHYRIFAKDKSEATELLRLVLGEIYVVKGLDKAFKHLKKKNVK